MAPNAEASSSKKNKKSAKNAPPAIAKTDGLATSKPARARASKKDTPRRAPVPLVYHQYKNEDDARAAFNRGKKSQWQHLGSLMGEKQKEAEELQEKLKRDAQQKAREKPQRSRKGKAPGRLLREPSQNVQGVVKSPVAGSSKLAEATVHKPEFPVTPDSPHGTYSSATGSGEQPTHRPVAPGHQAPHNPTAHPQVGTIAGARPQATGKRPAAEGPEVIEISSDSEEERPLRKIVNPRKRSSPTPDEGSRKKARTTPPAATVQPEVAPPVTATSKGKGTSKGKEKKVQDPLSQEATATPPAQPKKPKKTKAKQPQDATTEPAVPETKAKKAKKSKDAVTESAAAETKAKGKSTSRKPAAAAKDPLATTKAAARIPAAVPPPVAPTSTWQPASTSATPAGTPPAGGLSPKKPTDIQKDAYPGTGEGEDGLDFLALAMQGSDDAQDTSDDSSTTKTAAHEPGTGTQDVASGSLCEEPEDFLADALSEADDDDDDDDQKEEQEDFLAGELSEADDDDSGSGSTTAISSSNDRWPSQSSKGKQPATIQHYSGTSVSRSPPATSLPVFASAAAVLAHDEDESRDDGGLFGSDDSLFG